MKKIIYHKDHLIKIQPDLELGFTWAIADKNLSGQAFTAEQAERIAISKLSDAGETK